jgi:hypothetical protein
VPKAGFAIVNRDQLASNHVKRSDGGERTATVSRVVGKAEALSAAIGHPDGQLVRDKHDIP